jgi:hypothetical protein
VSVILEQLLILNLAPIGSLLQQPVIADVVDVPGTKMGLDEPPDKTKEPD